MEEEVHFVGSLFYWIQYSIAKNPGLGFGFDLTPGRVRVQV